jgi:ABC-type glycerol-3-phosphate transport system substrate-binding protein
MVKSGNKAKRSGGLAVSPSHLMHRVLQLALDIYTEETGPGGLTQRQFAVLEAVSQKSGSYDIITQHASSFGSFFRFLTPMDDRIKGVWGSVDKFEDWLFPAQKGVRNKDGKHYFIPFHANAQIGYYRRQLLEDPAEGPVRSAGLRGVARIATQTG